jgi:hypothetical protein
VKTSAQVRADLVRALAHDLVGPGPDDHELAEEVIPSAPSLWYLTGFLAPFEAPHHERQGDDAEGELDAGDKRVGKGDDEGAPEAAAARRGYFPASIGISLIVPAAARGLAVELTWGDYAPRDPAPDDARHRSRRADPWRRAPRRQTLTIPLDPLPTAPLPVPDSGGLEIVVNARTIDLPGLPPGARTLAVFLVNRRPPVDGPTDLAWCFQARLRLRADAPLVARPDLRRGDRPDGTFGDWDEEVAALHYRDSYEYAVGHNTAVRPLPEPHGGPCFAVETAWIPVADVEKVVPADVDAAELGMEALAAAAESPDTLTAALDGLALAYGAWIEDQAARFAALPGAEATVAELNERWRPFQLAFILMNLSGLSDPSHPDRAFVDLLFFPTGGGKTEAYLGLAAYTMVLRRLKNPGAAGAGLSVLMRYTLRLLTLDQLGRAATLLCALEQRRQQDTELLGTWPFEIGLWVGQSATPNRHGAPRRQGRAQRPRPGLGLPPETSARTPRRSPSRAAPGAGESSARTASCCCPTPRRPPSFGCAAPSGAACITGRTCPSSP